MVNNSTQVGLARPADISTDVHEPQDLASPAVVAGQTPVIRIKQHPAGSIYPVIRVEDRTTLVTRSLAP